MTRVVIDPGHGKSNEGAPSRHHPERFEKHFTLPISQMVAGRLRTAGVEVVLTREVDEYVTLARRVEIANEQRADVFVSVHLNSTQRPGPRGHETFFLSLDATDEAAKRLAEYENREPEPAAKSNLDSGETVAAILTDLAHNRAHRDAERLAEHIQGHLHKQSPFPDRGVRQAPFIVLMGLAMPAVVVEVGFINHPEEGRFITSPKGQAKLARAIAEGILDFGRLVLAPRAKGDVHGASP